MPTVDKECALLRTKYDNCFFMWYKEEFVSGNWKANDGQPCIDLFLKHRKCVEV